TTATSYYASRFFSKWVKTYRCAGKDRIPSISMLTAISRPPVSTEVIALWKHRQTIVEDWGDNEFSFFVARAHFNAGCCRCRMAVSSASVERLGFARCSQFREIAAGHRFSGGSHPGEG